MARTRIEYHHFAYRSITILIGLIFLAAGVFKGKILPRCKERIPA